MATLTTEFFADLATGRADPVARYQQDLAARDASYMQLETGTTTPRVKPDWAELSGYDRIALMTISAIAGNTGAVIPLNLPNRGTLPFLADDDIVEVPCTVDATGPHARPVAKVPAARPRAHQLREGVRARHRDRRDERRRARSASTRWRSIRWCIAAAGRVPGGRAAAGMSATPPRVARAAAESSRAASGRHGAPRSIARWACCRPRPPT